MKRKIALSIACLVIVLLLISIYLIRHNRKATVSDDVYDEVITEENVEE